MGGQPSPTLARGSGRGHDVASARSVTTDLPHARHGVREGPLPGDEKPNVCNRNVQAGIGSLASQWRGHTGIDAATCFWETVMGPKV
jgi:hypothetical protein